MDEIKTFKNHIGKPGMDDLCAIPLNDDWEDSQRLGAEVGVVVAGIGVAGALVAAAVALPPTIPAAAAFVGGMTGGFYAGVTGGVKVAQHVADRVFLGSHQDTIEQYAKTSPKECAAIYASAREPDLLKDPDNLSLFVKQNMSPDDKRAYKLLHPEQEARAQERTPKAETEKTETRDFAPGSTLEKAKDIDVSGTAFPAAASAKR